MAGDAVNRETLRDAFVALLDTALVGSSLPVQAIYGYQVGDFQDQSPVVVVTSGGSERDKKQIGSSLWHTWITLYIHVFVVYAIEGTAWGEDDAEDRLDLIDKEIADVVMDNATNAKWDNLEFEGPTETGVVDVGGSEYRYEVIGVRVRKLNG